MLKHSVFILFIVLSSLTYSCKKDNPYEKYEGAWTGTYEGEDTGAWSVNINDEGKVSGSAVSDSVSGFPFTLSGNVTEDGAFSAEASLFMATVSFNGQISGSSASGTWSNTDDGIQGTWSGGKN